MGWTKLKIKIEITEIPNESHICRRKFDGRDNLMKVRAIAQILARHRDDFFVNQQRWKKRLIGKLRESSEELAITKTVKNTVQRINRARWCWASLAIHWSGPPDFRRFCEISHEFTETLLFLLSVLDYTEHSAKNCLEIGVAVKAVQLTQTDKQINGWRIESVE